MKYHVRIHGLGLLMGVTMHFIIDLFPQMGTKIASLSVGITLSHSS